MDLLPVTQLKQAAQQEVAGPLTEDKGFDMGQLHCQPREPMQPPQPQWQIDVGLDAGCSLPRFCKPAFLGAAQEADHRMALWDHPMTLLLEQSRQAGTKVRTTAI
jgi:hypothetical protein